MPLLNVNDASFEQEVLRASKLVCVDFWADWCEPCRMMSPAVEELSQEYGGKIKFCKLNIDEAPVAAVIHKVMSIPTISFFFGGKEVKRLIGLRTKAELKQEFDGMFKDKA